MITSAQNSRIQHVRALLSQRKTRESSGEFALEGVRLVEEALASGWEARSLLYTAELSNRGQELVAISRLRGVEVEETAPHVLKAAADTENPQGILGVFARRELPLPERPNFVVIADGLRDPGNFGTLLRTAVAAGVQAVLSAPGSVDAFSPKVLRAGMGAHFRLPLREWSFAEMAAWLKPGCRVLLSESAQGTPCWQFDLRAPLALLVGAEAEGASAEGRALADALVTIPMPGNSESLNAAVAAGVLLFEVVRQRG